MSRLIFIVLLCAAVANAHLSKTEIHELARKAKAESRAMVDIGGKKYFVGSEITLDWSNALEFCNAFSGMSLASLESTDENTAIVEYYNANNLAEREFWTSLKEVEAMSWMWLGSGQIARFLNWASGQPDNMEAAPICVFMKSDGWYDDICSQQKNFICE